MTLRGFVQIVRANRYLIAIITGAALCVALACHFLIPDSFRASTQIYVSGTGTGASGAFAAQIVPSFAGVATSADVLDPVIEKLGLEETPTTLAERVSATNRIGTVLMTITADDASPARAAKLANAVAESTIRIVTERLESSSPVALHTITTATSPSRAVNPDLWAILTLGIVLGLSAGILTAVARAALSPARAEPEPVSADVEAGSRP